MGTHLQVKAVVRRGVEERDSFNVSSPDKPSMSITGGRTITTHRYLGLLLIIISAICFGAMPIFARVAYRSGADPITVLFLRFTIAAGVMVLIMLVRRTAFPRGRLLLYLALMGAFGYVGESLTYFTALTMASAGLVALLLYLYPAIVTLLAALFLKERLTFAKVGSLLLALTGIVLTLQLTAGGSTPGILLGILAAIIYAIYILVGSRVVVGTGAIASSTIVMVSTALVYTGIISVHGATFPKTSAGWVAVLAIALVSTVLAFVTFFAGLKRIGPTSASTFSTLEPVVTVMLAALLLGEDLSLVQMLGGALILVAVIVLARSEAKNNNGEARHVSASGIRGLVFRFRNRHASLVALRGQLIRMHTGSVGRGSASISAENSSNDKGDASGLSRPKDRAQPSSSRCQSSRMLLPCSKTREHLSQG